MSPPTSRLNTEAKEKTRFLNWCQEVGILEVLPYHECDLMSRDQPDYLTCLVRLQVQNISARYPVFITGETLLHRCIVPLYLINEIVFLLFLYKQDFINISNIYLNKSDCFQCHSH